MTSTPTLLERLEELRADLRVHAWNNGADLVREAAKTIKELEEALEPFRAAWEKACAQYPDEDPEEQPPFRGQLMPYVEPDDFRRAASALKASRGET